MSDLLSLGTVDQLRELVPILRERRLSLGLYQREVDELAGLADAYTSKIEAGVRGLGVMSADCLLGALKLRLVVVADDRSAREA